MLAEGSASHIALLGHHADGTGIDIFNDPKASGESKKGVDEVGLILGDE
jgi:hypothetical protein